MSYKIKQLLVLVTCLVFNFNTLAAAESWDQIRRSKLQRIERHVKDNPEGYSVFVNGSIGQGPFPALIFTLLPDLLPGLWGAPGQSMTSVGLSKNELLANHQLPLGVGIQSVDLEKIIGELGKNQNLQMAGFNCVACHAGKVQIVPGQTKIILGAPNTQINNVLFMFAKTVTNPNFKAQNISALLQSKPLGSLYGQSEESLRLEIEDRQVLRQDQVLEAMVGVMRSRGQALLAGFEKYIRPRTYDAFGQISPDPYALKKGSMDAFLPLHLSFADTFKSSSLILNLGLPSHTSETDVPSIWSQRKIGPVGHWDGNHRNPLFRNVGASAAGLNIPVNIKNVQVITEFLQDFPAEPYPFDVNMTMALRGKKLFQKNCTDCHTERNQVYSLSSIGTSPNRLKSITQAGAAFLGTAHLTLCDDPTRCKKPNGHGFLFFEIAKKTNGYVAGPLDGIWARAPYLHNGSVPTLHALLTGERPQKFHRGSSKYDQRLVGFKWDQPSAETVVYDTTLSGNSNAGHQGEKFLGFDPKKEPQKLWDLLEFLKTL